MVGFDKQLNELEAVDADVVAASVDNFDKAKEVADEVSFPVAHNVTREIANSLGSWWEERRGIIQPSEFIVGEDGKIVTSSYSSGPIGRIDATDVVKLITLYESRK